jgi:hypothetical protein
MKRKVVLLSILSTLVFTFVGLATPLVVHAACARYSGSYNSNMSPFTSPTFPVSAGDTVRASNIPSGATITNVSLEITINGRAFPPFGTGSATSANGSVIATANGTGSVFFANNNAPGATMHWTITVGKDCDNGVTGITFTDGRVNSHDGAETAAVYCNADGSVDVWTVYNSVGYFAFTATKADLAKVSEKPLKNTLIKSRLGVSLYRLTTGELQINSANDYVFIWDGCPV